MQVTGVLTPSSSMSAAAPSLEAVLLLASGEYLFCRRRKYLCGILHQLHVCAFTYSHKCHMRLTLRDLAGPTMLM